MFIELHWYKTNERHLVNIDRIVCMHEHKLDDGTGYTQVKMAASGQYGVELNVSEGIDVIKSMLIPKEEKDRFQTLED